MPEPLFAFNKQDKEAILQGIGADGGEHRHFTHPAAVQRIWRYTLNENFGATTSGQAAADLLTMGGTDTTRDVTILDPLGMFSDQLNGDPGFCVQDGGSYYALQAPCS